MKKKNCEKILCGFSLAEALITLLIVCLITLASVPVLTKKKRDTHNVSGMWMCSRKADGTYVYWSNTENSGDMSNPETWTPTNTDSCTFVPSINAKNFVVTIIGGGGAGGDGISTRKDYITNANDRYIPNEDGDYYLLVVGGGGGGAGGDSGSSISGGGGGAGGYYLAKVRLYAKDVHSAYVGNGGASKNGGGNKHSSLANAGENSAFRINSADYVIGYGGGGGRTRNCGVKCWGGGGGAGGGIEVKDVFSSRNAKYSLPVIFSGQGRSASEGTPGPGTVLPMDYSGLTQQYTYGSGGQGVARSNDWVSSGNAGAVRLWQIIKNGGLGGQAAKPLVLPLPSLRNNKLKAYIGEGGENATDGTQSYIQILDRSNKVIQQYSAQGGSAGTKNTTLDATAGENSLWNNKGGGAIGKCEPAQEATYTYKYEDRERVVTDSNGNPVCEFQVRDVGRYQGTQGGPRHICASNEVCIGYVGPNYTNNLSYLTYVKCKENLSKADEFSTIAYYRQILSSCATPSAFASSKPSHMLDSSTECLKEKKETYKEKILVEASPAKPATCEDSSGGVSFGAGGGGGAASDTLGVFGKGGKGAYGAVIVEW